MCTVQSSRHISVLWFNLAWGGVSGVPFKARATSVEPPATCINIRLNHWDLHNTHPLSSSLSPLLSSILCSKSPHLLILVLIVKEAVGVFSSSGYTWRTQDTLWWNNVHLDTRHSINFFAIFCVHWDIFYTEVINFTLREGFRKKESF